MDVILCLDPSQATKDGMRDGTWLDAVCYIILLLGRCHHGGRLLPFMDPEARYLLAPTPEQLASVKVFPLILSLRKEVTVSDSM
jgi:hypothetical protein